MNVKKIVLGMVLLLSSSSLVGGEIDQVIQALAPYAAGAKRPYYELRSSRFDEGALKADVAWTRSDGAVYEVILTISGAELQAVEPLQVSSAVDPETSASLLAPLKNLTPGSWIVTGVAQGSKGRTLVAYQQVTADTQEPRRLLAEVRGQGAEAYARPYRPRTQDQGLLQDLALVMARFQAQALAARYDAMTAAARARGEDFPGPLGPVSQLEVELRLARVTARQLEKQSADESAVGFDPSREWIQYRLPAVLSDNIIFVTFSRDGQYRLEDFN